MSETTSSAAAMHKRYRIIAQYTEGNVIGIVEELIAPPGTRAADLAHREDFRMVKIGVIDTARARREPFPAREFGVISGKLQEYLLHRKRTPTPIPRPKPPSPTT
jgi:hypothetical protein